MFKNVHAELGKQGRPRKFFVRDDDADQDVPELRRLLRLFQERNLPVSLAVVPGSLTKDCANLLKDSDGRAELHQHGWMHTNHEETGRKFEFGPSRSYQEQRDDIARGRERMERWFGRRFTPIFTPPWNRCTSETGAALEELDFLALSKDQSPALPHFSLPEVSISVDVFRWKGGMQLKRPAQLEEEILAVLLGSGPVGILLHHKVMDLAAFELTAKVLDSLRAHPLVRFQTMEALCQPES